MRYLLSLLFFFSLAFLSAQCFEANVISAECENGDGWFVEVEFVGEGNGWITSIDGNTITGTFDTVVSFGPFFQEVVVLDIGDLDEPDCVQTLDLDAPDGCLNTDPCFGFFMGLELEGACDTTSFLSVFFEGGNFPMVVELREADFAEVIQVDSFVSPNGTFLTIEDPGTYSVTATDPNGCQLVEIITINEGCGAISGRSWLDGNANGLRDPDETDARALVTLWRGDEVRFRSTTTDQAGRYAFEAVPAGDYFLEFVSLVDGREPTAYQTGDDRTVDNDMHEGGFTNPFTVENGGFVESIDAGWLAADCFAEIEIIRNADCSGENGGELLAIAGGGTPPYTYEWTNGQTGSRAIELAAGTYAVTITDALGCSAIGTGTILEGTDIRVFIQQSGGDCNDTAEVPTLFATVVGGTAPYTYTWSAGGAVIATTAGLEQVSPEVLYSLEVTDANGCTVFAESIFEPQGTTINFFAPFYLPCDGGPVTLSTGDLTDFLEYQWITPAGDTLFGPEVDVFEPGNYAVSAVSPNGTCFLSGNAWVAELSLASRDISIEAFGDSLCGASDCVYLIEEFGFELTPDTEVEWSLPNGESLITNPWNPVCDYGPGLYAAQVKGVCDTVTLTFLLEGAVECSALNGVLYVDQAGNCTLDGEDTPASGVMIVATSVATGEQYYALTNADGQYGFTIPVGDYTVRPVVDVNLPFGTCEPPAGGTVMAGSVTNIDVFLPALLDCPLMTTSVSIPFLRRCFDNVAYVDYANVGSTSVDDVTLTVTLDDFLINAVPSIPAVSQDGNTFTFNLGTVNPFERDRIFFTFTVSCQAFLGQSHCIESVISPSEPCTTPEDWNGALVNVSSGQCDGEEVTFSIQNVGDNPMSVPLSYVVVEDGIMMSGAPTEVESLPAGEIFEVNLPANGRTYHVITNQEPNAPASPTPTAVAEGCNTDPAGNTSSGFANIISLGNNVPSQAIACRQNVGAYDPNDKMGYPLGYDGGNIAAGTRLDYAIRFQNTGTDTAFNVVIQDTISTALDLSSFKVESASHAYTVSIDTHRVITFSFANIALPDSNVNLAASQGVINFSIDHAADLVPGDVIDNEARIYFDFNEPIVTNLSRHRIAKDGLPVGTRQQLARQVAVGISPNPGPGIIKVDIPRADVELTDVLTVTDLYGRQLAATTFGQLSSNWNVSHLPAGYYLLVVSNANGQAKGRAGFVIAK
ncbi:DUF7619 domain-containing protein [Neolewinella agarilytica]|uniref:Conserved repeat domain-containing protein/Por secretion system C-terminal sorting domain-containing protein n=1 Tax=Neolewinella agarilytica TaxID=478744 RepID=A0A1H8ZCG3_9BACT|nr:SdrD B-like domain-containing protein [Neolewinella agarilytica]SEP62109.1 conserved repeat domain-containing protein/Por secretion system C-terminal sorting domain-containing protein [Neolewinella agarilytica]